MLRRSASILGRNSQFSTLWRHQIRLQRYSNGTDTANSNPHGLKESTLSLLEGLRRGERRCLAKLITLVESTRPDHIEETSRLMAHINAEAREKEKALSTPRSFRIGFSGPPGVGKSTFIEAFGQFLLKKKHKVAVLAVDPSSERTGGSILGDKTRMQHLSRDDRAFVRPSPSRGTLGGVAKNTSEAVILCEEAGYDIILIETVGVGQSETAVDNLVDMFVLIVPPAGGDELQGMKKGIVELADLIIVNKADGELEPVAKLAQFEYMNAIKFLNYKNESWKPRVMRASALTHFNMDSVWESMAQFRHTMLTSGEFHKRRQQQRVKALWSILDDLLKKKLENDPTIAAAIPRFTADVQNGVITPSYAANQLLDLFIRHLKASE